MSTLSVVLAAYNEEAHLGAQLAALLQQSRAPDEVVFLDDGSTDATGAFLAAYPHPHKRCWRYARPEGPNGAYNRAVASATSEWLYLASANDVVQPGAFAAWAAEEAKWPGAVLMAGEVAGVPLAWSPTPGFLSPPELRRRWRQGSIIHGAGVFVRRRAWQAAGGYDVALAWLADWWLYHTLALRHGLVYLGQPISAVRPLPGSHSQGYRDPARLAAVVDAVAARLAEPASADVRADFLATGLLDIPEAGAGAVRRRLAAAVPA